MAIFLRKNNPEAPLIFGEKINKGGVVLHPTDTVYGLAASVHFPHALRRVYYLKGRSFSSPFLVLALEEHLRDLVRFIPTGLRRIWSDFIEKPVTVLLPSKVYLPFISKNGKIAIRIPADSFLKRTLSITGPIASTSANPSGKVLSPSQAIEYFSSKVSLVILGKGGGKSPSTILDFTTEPPRILRRGEYIPPFFTP